MYDDDEDPFPAPAPYQVPKDAKKIKERIRRDERALEQEESGDWEIIMMGVGSDSCWVPCT